MKSEANKLLVATSKKLLHQDGHPQLMKIIGRTHPADLAYVFNRLAKQERRDFFPLVSNPEQAAELLTEVEPLVLSEFLTTLSEHQIVSLLEQMSYDDAADVLAKIESEERRELLLTMMQREELATTQSLLEYDPESAGGLMVPDFIALNEAMTSREAIQCLQDDAGNAELVFYLYVVNEHHHLVGVTSLRELVLAPPTKTIRELMIREVIRVSVNTDQEEVARHIARYNLIAIPVVDDNNKLVGVVTVDDIIDVIRSEATEDMMLMAGAGDQQVDDLRMGLLASARARAPWMLPSALGGALCFLLLWSVSQRLPALIPWLFALPWLMMMGGNVATQSAAIVTRGIALGRTDFSAIGRVLTGELALGGLVGLGWGAAMALLSALLVDDAMLGALSPWLFAAITLGATCLILATSASLGALLPMIFSRLGLDPAIATGPLASSTVSTLNVAMWIALALVIM